MINGYKSAVTNTEITKNLDKQKCVNGESSTKYIKNPYINEEEDVLFHLQLSNKTNNLKAMFGDVKFVCMGGTPHRMKDFAYFIQNQLNLNISNENDLVDITGHGHRYSMFKVGPVLCVNHGMGLGSITILLHELIKLIQYAGVQDPIFIRIGTSGGIDLQAGTVIIAKQALNDYLEPFFEIPVLGKLERRPTILNEKLAKDILVTSREKFDFPILLGTIVSNQHFYESTAMKAAAICEHSDEERTEYYNKLKTANILNMDMETVALAAITHKVGIKAAVINVVTNDSFAEEEVCPSPEEFKEWQKRPQRIVAEYIKHCLNKQFPV